MSDVAQGHGWWLASDGRWYPPHLHPDYRPPPPPTIAGPQGPVTQTFRQPPVSPNVPVPGMPASSPQPSLHHSAPARQISVGAWLAISSGALLVVGALMPWVTLVGSFNSLNFNAFQHATREGLTWSWIGPVCVACGAINVAIGIASLMGAKLSGGLDRLPVVSALVAGVAAVEGIANVHSLTQSIHLRFVLTSIGYGIWVTLIGVAGSLAAGLLIPATGRTRKTASGLPPGWYADPEAPATAQRWWDGDKWGPSLDSNGAQGSPLQDPLPPFRR
jgi:hypothetical protein